MLKAAFCLTLLFFFSLPSEVLASAEDVFNHGTRYGSAGWDLSDDEDEGTEEAEKGKEVDQEQSEEKEGTSDDFFGKKVDFYDKDLAETRD